MQVKRNVKDVRMSMKLVHEVLVKAGRLDGCQRKEGETHTVSYKGKSYNLSYPHQQNYGYQPYNQYRGNALQTNYQSSFRPVVRFLALPPLAQVVTTQPMGQSSNNTKNLRGVRP